MTKFSATLNKKLWTAIATVAAIGIIFSIATAGGAWAQNTPGKPTNLTGTVTYNSVTLSWDAPADSVTGYQILRLQRGVDETRGLQRPGRQHG